MNLPSLPTDSLYKFVAMMGIIIAVAILYFQYQTTLIIHEFAQHKVEKIESLKKTGNKKDLAEAEKMEAEVTEYVRKRVDTNKTVTNCVFIFGLLVSALGFSLWWHRVQKWQDMITEAEGLKAQIELKDLRAGKKPD